MMGRGTAGLLICNCMMVGQSVGVAVRRVGARALAPHKTHLRGPAPCRPFDICPAVRHTARCPEALKPGC
jgi:hypothetical protein